MRTQTTARNLLHLRLLFLVAVVTLAPKVAQATPDQTNTNTSQAPPQQGAQPAAGQGNANTAVNPPAQPAAVLPPLDGVIVTKVYRMDDPDKGEKTPVDAGIRERIFVQVDNLDRLVKYVNCKSVDDRPVLNCQKQKIALFLDGREIKGLVPESGAPLPQEGTLQFHLERSADSDEAWADLLGAPSFNEGDKFYYRPTKVSVGLADGYALPTKINEPPNGNQFRLIRIHRAWFIVCTILLALVLILLFWLSLNSEILRDIGARPTGDKKGWIFTKKKHKPYSLARFQMAFWFFLVISAFLYIWLINGAFDTITASTLALIGIGAGTALGAAAIDLGKSQTDDNQLEDLKAEEATLQSDMAALDAKINAAAPPPNKADLEKTRSDKQTRLGVVQSKITSLSAAAAAKESDNFLNDILTGPDNGISFHRFQMFIWTLVLGILFVYSVWDRLSMPEFSATLLGLLGISNGTYLGFKIPEKQS